MTAAVSTAADTNGPRGENNLSCVFDEKFESQLWVHSPWNGQLPA